MIKKKTLLLMSIVMLTLVLPTSCDEEDTYGTLVVKFYNPVYEASPWLYVYAAGEYWTDTHPTAVRRLNRGQTYERLTLCSGNYVVEYVDYKGGGERREVHVEAGEVTEVRLPIRGNYY